MGEQVTETQEVTTVSQVQPAKIVKTTKQVTPQEVEQSVDTQ